MHEKKKIIYIYGMKFEIHLLRIISAELGKSQLVFDMQ